MNVVSLAIFSWDKIEPVEGAFTFEWLDHVIDRLGRAGIAVDLASATSRRTAVAVRIPSRGAAGRPVWSYRQRGLTPVVAAHKPGVQGIRAAPVPQTCRTLQGQPVCDRLAHGQRYGWNNRYDYSDNALAAFRTWCEAKYGTIDALNEACWARPSWSQHVNSFDEVLLPRHMGGDAMGQPVAAVGLRAVRQTTCCSTSTKPNATPSSRSAPTSRSPRTYGLHRPCAS